MKDSEIKTYKEYDYNTDPTKLTKQIEEITKYKIRKQNLEDEITRIKNSNEPNKTVQLGEVDPAASSAILKSLTLKEVATLLSVKASSELRPTDVSKDDSLTTHKTRYVLQG